MTEPPNVHLCLISAQVVPNLTPVLDPEAAPGRVILLTSPDMTTRADNLERVLAPRGVRVDRWTIDHPWDLEHIRDRVLDLLAAEDETDIALNATGGTKPMSIAAYEVFRDLGRPIFYVHPERDRLIWLHPGDRPSRDLANRLRLEAFLEAHGARVESLIRTPLPRPLRALTASLVRDAKRFERALGTLNWLAAGVRGDLLTDPVPTRGDPGPLNELIDRFAAESLLERHGKRLRFADEPARFFVNGGWLEDHIFDLAIRLRGAVPAIQDVARGVEVLRATSRGEVPNEIDVAVLADNRLYLIECKTRNWKPNGRGAPGANALYRLDSLKDLLGGLQARALLTSYRPLPAYDRQRAADLRIRVCAGPESLSTLRSDLSRWLGGER